MTVVAYAVLAFLILGVLADNVTIGAVVAGLLFFVIQLGNKVAELSKKITKLEHALNDKSTKPLTKPEAEFEGQDLSIAQSQETYAASASTIAKVTMSAEQVEQQRSLDKGHGAEVTEKVENDNLQPVIAIDEEQSLKLSDVETESEEPSFDETLKDRQITPQEEKATDSLLAEGSLLADVSLSAEGSLPTDDSNVGGVTTKAVTPAKPHLIEVLFRKLFDFAWGWVTGGNPFVRVGMILLFMGMSFLVRYAIGEGLISIEARLITVGLFAIGLLCLGWSKREQRENFSLVLQGGGIGLLYLTIFASFSLYKVLPSTLSFVLLSVTVILAAILSVQQNARPLALFATVGGFLAPVLTSSGNNNYVGLFTYYSILNIGIFSLAWFKSWRILNFVGFLFTFLISTAWGVLRYHAENFTTTEPFLIFFFLLYVAIGILYAYKRTNFHKDYVDGSIIFGTPIFVFGLQTAMVQHIEYGVAISAACLGVFYVLLATVLWRKFAERLKLLSETFLSLGVIFLTLAIPFAIDGKLTAAAWAIEGAGILWLSIKQKHALRRFFGIGLVFLAGVMLFYGLFTSYSPEASNPQSQAFFNSFFIGCVLIAIAASISSCLLSKDFEGRYSVEKIFSSVLLIYAILVLLTGFSFEVRDFYLVKPQGSLLALLSAVAIFAYSVFAKRANWREGHFASTFFILIIVISSALSVLLQDQLANYYGYILWPLVISFGFYGLKNARNVLPSWLSLTAHIIHAVSLITLLFWEGIWQLMLGYTLLAILFNFLSNKFNWPELKVLSIGFLLILLLCGITAIAIDGHADNPT